VEGVGLKHFLQRSHVMTCRLPIRRWFVSTSPSSNSDSKSQHRSEREPERCPAPDALANRRSTPELW